MKPRQLSWKWLLLGLVVLVLAGLAVLPHQIGTSANLRDRVAAALSTWTGATVTLTEPLSVRYFPPLSLRGGFVLTDATKLPLVSSITAKDAKISLSVPDLLVGRIKIDALRLGRPTITLKDAGGPAMPPPQTARALITNVLASAPVRTVRIGRGTIIAASGELLLNELDARFDASAGSGALTALGSFDFRGETVHFAIDSGRVSETEGVQTAPVTLTVTSESVAVKASGTASSGEDFALSGDMQVEMSNARRFLNWVGMPLPPGDSLQGLSASGPFHWNGTTLTFDDGALTLDGNTAVGLFAITTGAQPRVEGTLAFEHLVLDPYLGGDEPAAADGPLLDWVLKYFEADLRISAGEVSALTMDLGHGGFTITAKQGVISSEVGELELCGGQAAGRVWLDLSAPRTEASLAGTLSGVAIESCLQPFGLGVPIKGVGSLKIDVSTGGSTKEELIRGLAGVLKITAENGAVPIDFPQLMTGTGANGDGWSRESLTPFDSLDADCRLSAGHIWCQSFKMQTGRSLVSGSGGVDVGRQTLDWDLLIADPVAQLSASQLIMETPPRVTIRGPLTQPLIQRANHSTLGDGSTQSDTGNAPVSPR